MALRNGSNMGAMNDPVDWRTLDEAERIFILTRLDIMKGNRTHTAKSLGIAIRTLRHKLDRYRYEGHAVMEHADGKYLPKGKRKTKV